MDKIILTLKGLIISIIFSHFNACSTTKKLTNGSFVDSKLFGVWESSETNAQTNKIEKKKHIERKAEGSYALKTTTIKKEKSIVVSESGTWKVEDQTTIVYTNSRNQISAFQFTIENKDLIKFDAINIEEKDSALNNSYIENRVVSTAKATSTVKATLATKAKGASAPNKTSAVKKETENNKPKKKRWFIF